MLIPSEGYAAREMETSLSRRVNANSQPLPEDEPWMSQAYQEG